MDPEERTRRGLSFGSIAAQYDRARPSYPRGLVDHLLAAGPPDVLDLGTGTGKAARLFAARGCRVLGLEPDPGMAGVARSHGVEVEIARLEDWDPAGRRFDLVTAAQSWHWFDPDRAAAQVAKVTRPGGVVAAFWNRTTLPEAVRESLRARYSELVPGLRALVVWGEPGDYAGDPDRLGLDVTGAFEPVIERVFDWSRSYSTAEWLAYIRTHSDHNLLPVPARDRLLAAVAAVIDGVGGSIEVDFSTLLLTAVRRRAVRPRSG